MGCCTARDDEKDPENKNNKILRRQVDKRDSNMNQFEKNTSQLPVEKEMKNLKKTQT